MEDILLMSALELAAAIRGKTVSVKEAAAFYRTRIARLEPQIHAFLSVNEESFEQRIRQIEQGIYSGVYKGRLAGVPVVLKDNICTKGQKTTCASKMLENFVPSYDAEVARRIEKAGMIVLGKTNMDEFAMGSTTETSAFGVTKNPWDLTRVPGGSSGGSCAAVAAGESVLALGSDTGGSIRQPASYCGVVGLKPTYGRVSRYGLVAYASSMDQIGPIGRNVRDCAALYEIIAGYDEKDSTSSGRPLQVWEEPGLRAFDGIRIGIPREFLENETQDEVRCALECAARLMETHGAKIEVFSLPLTEYMIPAYYVLACAEASSNLSRFDGVKYGYRSPGAKDIHELYRKSRTEGFGEEVKRRILLGNFVLSAGYYDAYYQQASHARKQIKRTFDRVFSEYDLLLAPAAPTTAPKLGDTLKDTLGMYKNDIDTVAVNLAGLPAISVPCGRDRKGLPIGMQLIADRFREKELLQAAAFYENLRGPFPLPEEVIV